MSLDLPWDLQTPEQRGYFAALGEGLVVVLPPSPPHRGGRIFPDGGTWLHVGVDGAVHAFTGKVDVGQDTRTALSLLVAEELRVPLDQVRLVMGDTQRSPWDIGTFGSRSMPDAGEHLRLIAAAARAVLLELAATRWGIEADALIAASGAVQHPGGTGSSGYGELLRGQRRMVEATSDAPVTPPSEWMIAGRPTLKVIGRDLVTGSHRFPSDLTLPDMLHGNVIRPPAFGARLRSLDVTAARAMPGVVVVQERDFTGVAAPDLLLARAAAEAVRAEWELTPQRSEAMLEQHLRSHPVELAGFWGAVHDEKGDVDRAFAGAPVQLAATYRTAYLAHAPLECRAALAQWEDGRLTVWVGTQQPFSVRRELAEALAFPERQITVVVPDTGGAFGGKHSGDCAIEAARLARAAGKPVKLLWTREEEFTWAYVRPAAIIDVRSGVERDGSLLSWEFLNVNAGSAGIGCPYAFPNQRIDFTPADSPLRQGSYRALAATANHFARESHIDDLAHAVGVDPLELRLRHLEDDRLRTVLRAAAERIGWNRAKGAPGHGVGIAAGVEKEGRVATAVEVQVHAHGELEVVRVVTAYECGALVNPDNVRSQIEGAAVMGLGGALFEAVHFDAGRILHPRFSEYRVPRFSDTPPIDVVLVERKDLPFAGAGETPIVAIAPAIANAIVAATGRRLRDLPLVPNGRVE